MSWANLEIRDVRPKTSVFLWFMPSTGQRTRLTNGSYKYPPARVPSESYPIFIQHWMSIPVVRIAANEQGTSPPLGAAGSSRSQRGDSLAQSVCSEANPIICPFPQCHPGSLNCVKALVRWATGKRTSAGAVRGSWCLQVHVASAFSRGVQRKVADSRGAAVIS